MRFQGQGVLFVHLLDPSLNFAEKATSLAAAVEDAREPAEQELSHDRVLGDARVLAVAGECDLLLQLDLSDFRAIPVLQKHLLGAGVQSAAWVLSIPYDLPTAAADIAHTSAVGGQAIRPIHFVTHVRLQRFVYRQPGGEDAVLEHLAALLREFPGVDSVIHSALGWFDLLISGDFSVPPQTFATLLARLSNLRLGGEPGKVAVQKMLTLLAFEPGAGNSQPIPRPIIVARTSSAGYTGAVAHLKTKLANLDPVFYHVDGTRDFLIMPGERFRPQGIEDVLIALSPGGSEIRDAGIERLETHLLVMRHEDLEKRPATAKEPTTDREQVERCACSQVAQVLKDLGLRVGKLLVPRALQQTVINVLTLHSYSLNDEATCCDLRPALIACAAALDRVLSRIEGLQRLREEDPQHATKWFEALNDRRELLDRWCTYAESILSERVAGGFQEFFEVNDRLVAYRGGVQKLLFITDHLLSAFLSEVDPPLSPTLDTAVPLFATLHEPISAIRSEAALGFVKLPLRYRFSLPTVLPQLWHEVGQFVFDHRYPIPVDPEMALLLSKLDELLKRRVEALVRDRTALKENLHIPNLPQDEKLSLQEQLQRLEEDLERIAISDQSEILSILSDMYADLIVFVFGFRGRFPEFVYYLTTLYFDLAREERQESGMWERACDVLLVRLYYVSRLAILWRAGNELRSDGARKLRIDDLLTQVHEVAKSAPYKDHLPPLPRELLKRVYRIVSSSVVVTQFYEHFLQDFYKEYIVRIDESPPVDWQMDEAVGRQLENGEVVELGVPHQVNSCYEFLYTRQLKERLGYLERSPASVWFRRIAALGKSALLAFYQESARHSVAK